MTDIKLQVWVKIFLKNKVRLTYVGDTKREPKLDISENIDYKWLTLEEIKNQENLDIYVKEIVDLGLAKLFLVNDFENWNNEKQKIDNEEYSTENFPQIGEVWMGAVGKNIGFEQNGVGSNFSRPLAIVKKFNNKMFWVLSLSTKQKKLDFYYNFKDPNGHNSSIILAQLKLVSLKRLKRKMFNLSETDFKNILDKLRKYLE